MPERRAPVAIPESQRLREAVVAFSGKNGLHAVTIATVAEKFIGLLAARWEHICDVAMAEESNGQVCIGFRVSFDMTCKAPVGNVCLSFAQRTKEEAEFAVDDPEQARFPFNEPERPAVQSAATLAPEAADAAGDATPELSIRPDRKLNNTNTAPVVMAGADPST